jgi:hypothetical protein
LELASSSQFDGQGDQYALPRFVEQASQSKKNLANVGFPVEALNVHKSTHPARGPLQSDLWDSTTANEWEVNAKYPDEADQDQSLHW